MSIARKTLFATMALAFVAAPALAQQPATTSSEGSSASTEEAEAVKLQPEIVVQNYRPYDQRGINVFETPKQKDAQFDGIKIQWGAAFTQQFQALSHSNTADEKLVDGKDVNELADIGAGFNLASANLNVNVQLAPGIRVALESYMSSRHHNEFWVKGGYLQIDESPIDLPVLNALMDYVTVKAGMFELNYGDAHFRRSDNGNSIYNPFVENYIIDSFNTEIGAEVYVRSGPWMVMGGATNGINKGQVTDPDDRGMALLAKAGYDNQITDDVRVRLTGSMYKVDKTPSSNLFGGDRAGSHYFNVMDNAAGAAFTNGRVNPGFRNQVKAFQVNPFVKVGGVELFGLIEQAEGKAAAEAETRTWNQYAVDAVYRFLPAEQMFVGARYNTASGRLSGMDSDVSIDRTALGAGWFITPTILVKGEYVTQKYNDFPTANILSGGKFDGFMIEGVVGF